MKNKVIAVDFDGTLTFESKYPVTGELNMKAIDVVKELKKENILILWTCRENEELQEAIDLCKNVGLCFDYVNENIEGRNSRKVWADIYLDDKAINVISNELLKEKI